MHRKTSINIRLLPFEGRNVESLRVRLISYEHMDVMTFVIRST